MRDDELEDMSEGGEGAGNQRVKERRVSGKDDRLQVGEGEQGREKVGPIDACGGWGE